MTKHLTNIAAAAVIAVLAAAAIVGLYQLGWWVNKDSTNRNARVNRQSYGAQTAYADKVVELMADIAELDAKPEQTDTIRAQRRALVVQACRLSARLTTPFTGDIAAFTAQEC